MATSPSRCAVCCSQVLLHFGSLLLTLLCLVPLGWEVDILSLVGGFKSSRIKCCCLVLFACDHLTTFMHWEETSWVPCVCKSRFIMHWPSSVAFRSLKASGEGRCVAVMVQSGTAGATPACSHGAGWNHALSMQQPSAVLHRELLAQPKQEWGVSSLTLPVRMLALEPPNTLLLVEGANIPVSVCAQCCLRHFPSSFEYSLLLSPNALLPIEEANTDGTAHM